MGQVHAASFTTHRDYPALQGKLMRHLHQMRLGNFISLRDLGNRAQPLGSE